MRGTAWLWACANRPPSSRWNKRTAERGSPRLLEWRMTTLPAFCTPVPLDKAYRLLNHGPTVLVSSAHAGQHNVMAAAWSMPLDFSPTKVTVVIDKATRTRALVEGSGWFALNVPSRALAQATLGVGSDSAADTPDKLQRHGLRTFEVTSSALPLVQGCVGWLLCKVVPY
jgi:flavin reductase (DIM6/NTAB) family NADH-FMN oxidoreductase RutF